MSYRERPVAPGVVLWSSVPGPGGTMVLPDGCLDLVWDSRRLVVAGPDTRARQHVGPSVRHVGLRFGRGLGPGALGVPADELCDALVGLDAVWGDRRARALTDEVADDPEEALAAFVRRRAGASGGGASGSGALGAGAFGTRVFAAAGAGRSVASTADALGVSVRTLHRRCLPVFGYGPRHLGRVLRLQRALAAARAGRGWARVATETGYVDQAHLAREVRALTGTTPGALVPSDAPAQDPSGPPAQDRGANRSTEAPSGSSTTA